MDHNLELNLEGAMESMDFDNSGVVVSQADITLETSGHEGDMPMEFEEQQMLMDTGTEEIIVADFMGDQFTLQEYAVQDDQTIDSNVTVEFNPMGTITSSSDTMIDLQLDSESISHSIREATSVQPKFISVKAPVSTARTIKKAEAAAVPRQVAIAPKPPKLIQTQKATFSSGKQYTIAPKPVALVMNKSLKKVSLSGVQAAKGTTVIRPQMNKQYVMVPTDGSQKIKLVSARSGTTLQCVPASSDHAQLIPNKSMNTTQITKPIMGKVIIQGQSTPDASNQSAVIRKLLPTSVAPTPTTGATHARYIMQPKSMPIFIGGNKVVLSSPTKQGAKLAAKKQQVISIKSSPQKIVPVTTQATTKKVVITANPNNVILKTTAPPKPPTVSKDGSVVVQGQRSQLHQINVPGKGIQYIRLITSSSTPSSLGAVSAPAPVLAPVSMPAPKPGSWGPALPAKSFLLTDNKGNLIQMTGEKMVAGQPPPLVITGNVTVGGKVPSKHERKLVRIAPVTSKSGHTVTTVVRSSQSLLAPVAPSETDVHTELQERLEEDHTQQEEDMLQEQSDDVIHTLDIKYESMQSPEIEETEQSMNSNDDSKDDEHPLIVIPSTFRQIQSQYSENNKQEDVLYSDEDSKHILEDQKSFNNMVSVEAEIVPYQSPQTPQALSDSDVVPTDLGLRPRKACNCTKSQCLKLYCDCFANGEFCNSCNCNNCHNNLENEELRQKAIRACLDRNPNAFRPKIGKAKSGGPEIVRRHNKGCNCKRSGCLKNYCECYEAKIACTAMCKCVGCRNVEETLERRRNMQLREKLADSSFRPSNIGQSNKQPCSFMTSEVIEAVCQCLVAAAVEGGDTDEEADPMRDVIEEFARCLQEIIGASHQQGPA